ncbi:MAG: gas vesicle protein GvpD P-loop domain-containing protein [Candidatus Nitrosocaldaceae archaeon]
MTLTIEENGLGSIFANFFKANPTSLLIRGDPGVGKTTLALELLNYVKPYYRGCYISTRVSYEKLIQQIPWCKDLLIDENVMRPFASNMKGTAPLVDVRLGTINIIVEMVMSAVMKDRAFIILDSWDALAKEADMKERLKAEKTMVSLADANNGFIIFISEEPVLNTVAYLVDAVVTLENKTIRYMRIDKMRGSQISDKYIFYSLIDSHFTPINRQNIVFNKPNRIFEPIVYERKRSTGNKYLDNAINKIGAGNVILFEVSENRDRRVLGLILLNMILNYMRSGGSAIVFNTPDKPYASILNHIKPYCTEEDLERLILVSSDINLPAYQYLEKMSYEDIMGTFERVITNRYPQLKIKSNKPCLLSVDIGMCEARINEKDAIGNNLLVLANIFRSNGDNMVFVLTDKHKNFATTQSIADIHLKLFTKDGVSFIKTIKPYNGIYGIIIDDNEYPLYKLVKMV